MKLLLLLFFGAILGLVRARSVATYDQRQDGKVNVQIDVKDVQIVALVDSEMLEDYTNYDYAYDYADFTIKPSSRPTTGKPSPSTGASDTVNATETWSTWPTSTAAAPLEVVSSTKAPETSGDATSTTAKDEDDSPTTVAVQMVQHLPTVDDESKKILEAVSNASKIEAEKHHQQQAQNDELTTAATTTTTTSTTTTTISVAQDESKPDAIKRPAAAAEPRKRCPVGFLLKSGKCFKRRYSLISPRIALMKLAPALLAKSTSALSRLPGLAAA